MRWTSLPSGNFSFVCCSPSYRRFTGKGGTVFGVEFCNWNNLVGRKVLLCIFCCVIGEIGEVEIYLSLFSLEIVLIPNNAVFLIIKICKK